MPNDEAKEIMDGIGGQSMGFLFENMEKMDIQAERKNTAREKKRADNAEALANEQKLRADSLADEVQRLRAEHHYEGKVTYWYF